MKLIGEGQVPPSWSKQLEELIVYAITGERRAVVEKLDALVKGYKPMYEFHGGPDATGDLAPDLSRPSPPSKSVH
jgi:hypothetical protein